MDRSSRQKINKEKQALNDTFGWVGLNWYFRASIQKQKTTQFSQLHTEHSPGWPHAGPMVGRGKFKKIEIISSIFSDHDNLRLEINYKKKKKL